MEYSATKPLEALGEREGGGGGGEREGSPIILCLD